MALRLITETVEHVRTVIQEQTTPTGMKKPAYYIEGIFMQGNKKNQNGRIYPMETLIREAKRYHKDFIEQKRSYGELGHPDTPTVNLDRASHMIVELQQNGEDMTGKAKILSETPMGKIVTAILDEEGQLGVSTRGVGSLNQSPDGAVVQPDFYLAAVDIVADPSAPNAFVRGIMENKAWVWDNGVLRECAVEQMARAIDRAHRPTVSTEERSVVFLNTYGQFLNELRNGVTSKIR